MKQKVLKTCGLVIECCIYGLAFFTPISIAFANIFSWFGILAFIIKQVIEKDFSKYKKPVFYFLGVFLLFCGLSLINSGIYIHKSLVALLLKWLKYVLIFIFVQDSIKTKKQFINTIVIMLLSIGLVSIDGLWQRFFGIDFLRHKAISWLDGRKLSGITGPLNHYNDFAAYLLVGVSLNIGWLISSCHNRGVRLFAFLAVFASSLCLVLTYSRGGWIGMVIVIFVLLLFTRKYKTVLFLFLIFVIIFSVVPGIGDRKMLSLQEQGAPTAQQTILPVWRTSPFIFYDGGRFRIWGAAVRMIKEDPLIGKGIGTFMPYFEKYRPDLEVQYAHNCFLQIWAETGVFSLLAFILFIGVVFLRGLRLFKKERDFFSIALIAGMFGFLTHSFFDTNLYSLQLATVFWMCMGIIYAKTNILE